MAVTKFYGMSIYTSEKNPCLRLRQRRDVYDKAIEDPLVVLADGMMVEVLEQILKPHEFVSLQDGDVLYSYAASGGAFQKACSYKLEDCHADPEMEGHCLCLSSIGVERRLYLDLCDPDAMPHFLRAVGNECRTDLDRVFRQQKDRQPRPDPIPWDDMRF